MIVATRFCGLAPAAGLSLVGLLIAGFLMGAPAWGQSASPETPPAPLANPNLAADAASAAVGSIRGDFRVSESGAASYAIAVMPAPAGGGLVPEIGLGYNSQSGNGAAGLGWDISGLSSITRCAQTLEAGDPRPVGMSLGTSDRFCLDGQRLIVSSGAYGANGAEYRMAVDQIVRVRSYGAVASGPAWFKVWRKDGTISWYGAADDGGAMHSSRVMSKTTANPVFAWHLARVQDSAGNYMLIDWQDRHSTLTRVETVPTAVRYGGNGALTPNNEIRFDWALRPAVDQSVGFAAGMELASTARLTAIRSLADGAEIRRYALAYRAGTTDTAGKSALASITECRGTTCYPATTLTWNVGQLALGALSGTTAVDFSLDAGKTVTYQSPDLNGDGMADFISLEKQSGSAAPRFRWALSQRSSIGGVSFTAPTDCAIASNCPLMGGGVRSDASSFPRWVLMDVDGNGYNDIVYAYLTPGTTTRRFYAHFWDGVRFGAAIHVGTFAASAEQLQALDWNGDGRVDLMYDADQGRIRVARNMGFSAANPAATFVEQTSFALLLQPSHFSLPGPSMLGFPNFRFTAERVLDANGDGLADIILEVRETYCPPGCGVQIYSVPAPTEPVAGEPVEGEPVAPEDGSIESSGTATQGRYILFEMRWNETAQRHELISRAVLAATSDDQAGGYAKASEMRIADLNADGLADIVYFNLSSSRWEYRLSTGAGSYKAARAIANWPTDSSLRKYVQLVDVNGDGHPDGLIPSVYNDSTAVWRVSAWDRSLDSGNGNFGVLASTEAQSGNLSNGANSLFVDFNGDGKLDQLQVVPAGSNRDFRRGWGRNTTTLSSSYEGVFLLRRITDGFGAWTELSYKSLVQRSVHTRDRNGPYLSYGLGSVVYDIVPAAYVVSAATSLAPQYTLNATATGSTYAATGTTRIEYYYTGAKIQAGGRGFLGFREVASWDPQSGMLTRTRYRQDFPFIGLPEETHSWYKASAPWTFTEASAALGPCTTCANTAIATTGVLLGRAVNTWSERVTVAGLTPPLTHPYMSRSEEWSYIPVYTSGALIGSAFTARVVTENTSLDVYGNIGQVVTATYTSTSGTTNLVARQTAVNTYTNNATTTLWHLGRLSCTVATSERAGQTTQTRRSTFGYNATTGLLNRETVQPSDCGTTGAQLNTVYTHDAFGNRLETTVAAAGVTGSRRSQVVYDSRGRYPIRSEVFLAGVWRAVERSEGHDAYGNPARTIRAFGSTTAGVTGHHYFDTMGRPYYSYTPDGAWSRVRHGLGAPAGLSCPTGTVTHQRTDQGATVADYIVAYTCKDVLGREIRTAARAFDGGWMFSDTRYDYAARAVEVSAPYLSGQTAYWTRSVYDELGRVEALRAPDPANGSPLDTWAWTTTGSGLGLGVRTTHTNALGQVHRSDRNALGEKISETAADGGITTYGYDALGNLLFTDGPLTGTVDRINISYNALGQKTQMVDPDKGTWQYHTNNFGELVCQRDAKSQATRFVYDELGRQTSRTDLSGVTSVTTCTGTQRGVTTWTYGNTAGASNFGQVTAESAQYADGVGADHTASRSYLYDTLGRMYQVSTTILDGTFSRSYTERTTFDQHGRVFQSFDASGDSRGIRHVYNPRGYVSQLKESREGTAGKIYWTVQAMNARGQVTGALMGNGTQITASHDAATGAVLQLMDATGTAMAQDLFMAWDALGNLTSRRDWSGNRNQEEQFFYDARNRLTRTDSRVNGGTWVLNRQVQTYNTAGNMLTKTGLGTYTYDSTRPHAVTSAGGVTYTYDANGNVISDTSGRAFHYTGYDLVRRVSQGTAHTEFHYDAGRARTLKRELSGSTVTARTHYLGSVEVVWNGSNPTTGVGQYRRTIGGVVINTFFQSTGVNQQRYLHRDHLGSIVAISDEAGQIVTWMAFDPWGLRRNADAWHPWNAPPSVYLNAMLAITPRGFTGHEHVDSAGIIHMNGRIYDPKLGRFLQADPFVEDSTTLNRYTYVHNNPLAYTDPSGYFSLKKIFKGVAGGVLGAAIGRPLMRALGPQVSGALIAIGSVFCGPYAPACAAVGNYELTQAFGGSVKDALRNGLVAGASQWAFGGGSAPSPGQAAVQASLNVVAARHPELGQALMFVYGNLGNGPGAWLQDAVGRGMQLAAADQLEKQAERIGLTLGELNAILAVNSWVGTKIAGTTYTPNYSDGTGTVEGFFSRHRSRYLGGIWDVNDTLLNIQGLPDAITRSIMLDPSRPSDLTGHSLGAWRVNNLARMGLIESGTTLSLPGLAYPAIGTTSLCATRDLFCGTAILSLLRPNTASVPSRGLFPHRICSVEGYSQRWSTSC